MLKMLSELNKMDYDLILDTSPLIIFLVGSFNKKYLEKVKYKNRRFDAIDYDLLLQYFSGKKLFVTPHILTEMSNIVENSLGKELFQEFIENVSMLLKNDTIEVYIPKEQIILTEGLKKFWFGDMSLFCSGEDNNHEIIVGDLQLYSFCKSKKRNVEFLDTILSPKWN